jgi:hypothetical protein
MPQIVIESLNQTELSSTTKPQSEVNTQPKFDKSLKIADFLDFVYSYPPKIKIRWDDLDGLIDNLLDWDCRDVCENSPGFDGPTLLAELGNDLKSEIAVPENYSRAEYWNGIIDRFYSSNFFRKKTREIQFALSNVPVFVALNGQGEILLNKPSNILSSQNTETYLNEKVYDWCGGFDLAVEKKPKFGCFFMNFKDAELYINEVGRLDIEGTKTVGLSVHCVSMASAYSVTREYHPGIDFRFIPHFEQVKAILPSQNTQYFKGVPIYIVPLFNGINNVLLGPDKIAPNTNTTEFQKYIFFEKQQAVKFCKKNRRIISRKPTILVSNLEDFIEDWEDDLIVGKNVDGNERLPAVNFFVSPTENLEKIKNFSNSKNTQFPIINNVANYLTVNYKVLKRAIGIFFSV